jgi:hypothetical protein
MKIINQLFYVMEDQSIPTLDFRSMPEVQYVGTSTFNFMFFVYCTYQAISTQTDTFMRAWRIMGGMWEELVGMQHIVDRTFCL